jgi:hypothetical protein
MDIFKPQMLWHIVLVCMALEHGVGALHFDDASLAGDLCSQTKHGYAACHKIVSAIVDAAFAREHNDMAMPSGLVPKSIDTRTVVNTKYVRYAVHPDTAIAALEVLPFVCDPRDDDEGNINAAASAFRDVFLFVARSDEYRLIIDRPRCDHIPPPKGPLELAKSLVHPMWYDIASAAAAVALAACTCGLVGYTPWLPRDDDDDYEDGVLPAPINGVEPPHGEEPCVVCLEWRREYAGAQCGHLSLCGTCVGRASLACALCRVENPWYTRIFR